MQTKSIPTALAVLSLFLLDIVTAHTVIVYPGYRGNNLHTNGTVEEAVGQGQAVVNDTTIFPYGMMWMYPCEFYYTAFCVCFP